jgi:hypothetical protein
MLIYQREKPCFATILTEIMCLLVKNVTNDIKMANFMTLNLSGALYVFSQELSLYFDKRYY